MICDQIGVIPALLATATPMIGIGKSVVNIDWKYPQGDRKYMASPS